MGAGEGRTAAVGPGAGVGEACSVGVGGALGAALDVAVGLALAPDVACGVEAWRTGVVGLAWQPATNASIK
jgi:hypothetical protein